VTDQAFGYYLLSGGDTLQSLGEPTLYPVDRVTTLARRLRVGLMPVGFFVDGFLTRFLARGGGPGKDKKVGPNISTFHQMCSSSWKKHEPV
jgi:hypothetical protein